ncbi:MAG: hypothetical protein WBF97_10365, partial [Comamonas sp.]
MFRGVVFALLAIFGLIAGADVATAESFNATQKSEIEKIVRDYLLKNPELMIEVMSELEAKQASKEEKRANAAIAEHRKTIYD